MNYGCERERGVGEGWGGGGGDGRRSWWVRGRCDGVGRGVREV